MTLRIQVKKEHTAIVLILILAFVLRFYNILIDSDFLFREGTWGMSAWRIIEGDIPYRDFFHAHPPVSPYLLAIIFLIFGVGVIQARLFVIGITIFTCFLIYLGGKRIDKQIGLIGSLIFAVSPISLYYGMFAVNDFVAVTFCIIGFLLLTSVIPQTKFQATSLKMEKGALILVAIFIGLGVIINSELDLLNPYLVILMIGGICVTGYSFLASVIKQIKLQETNPETEKATLILAPIFMGLGLLVRGYLEYSIFRTILLIIIIMCFFVVVSYFLISITRQVKLQEIPPKTEKGALTLAVVFLGLGVLLRWVLEYSLFRRFLLILLLGGFCIVLSYIVLSIILLIKQTKLLGTISKTEKGALILGVIFVGIGIIVRIFFESLFLTILSIMIIGGICVVGYYFLLLVFKRDKRKEAIFETEKPVLLLAGAFVGLGVLVKTFLAIFFLVFLIILIIECWIAGIQLRSLVENIFYFAIGFLVTVLLVSAIFYGIAGDTFIDQIFVQHISKESRELDDRIRKAILVLAEANYIIFVLFIISAPFAARTPYGRGLLISISILVGSIILALPAQYANYYHSAVPLMAMVCGFLPITAFKSLNIRRTKFFNWETAKVVLTLSLLVLVAVNSEPDYELEPDFSFSYMRLAENDKMAIDWLKSNTAPDEYILTDNLNINFQAGRRSPFAEISMDRTNLDLLDGEMFIEACYAFDIRVVVSTGRLFGYEDEYDVFLEFLAENYEANHLGHTIYLRTLPL